MEDSVSDGRIILIFILEKWNAKGTLDLCRQERDKLRALVSRIMNLPAP